MTNKINWSEVRLDPQEGGYFVPTRPTWVKTSEELRSAIREGSYQDALDFISSMDKDAVGEPDNYGQTALHWAALSDNEELCKVLIEKMDPEAICFQTYESRQTALHFATREGSKKFIKLLMESKFAQQLAETKDKDSQTPLHCAVIARNLEVIQLLISNTEVTKELVKAVDSAGQTALHWAAGLGDLKICEALYSHSKSAGVFVNPIKTKDHEYTVLHLAVHAKQAKIVHLFTDTLKKGKGLVGVVDRYGQTPLHWAAWMDCYEICEILYNKMTRKQIQIAMDPKERNQTALHFAVQKKSQKIVELLLTRNDVAKRLAGLQDKYGQTALHWAAGLGDLKICENLYNKMTPKQIQIAMDPKERNQTALHIAVQAKDEKMVKILISNPAVRKQLIGIIDHDKNTALDLAKKLELVEIEKLLK